jgi:hypothetical protein
MKLLVILVFALLLLSKCAPTIPGQSIVKSDPNLQYPALTSGVALWLSVIETFDPELETSTTHCPLDGLYAKPPAAHLQQIEKFRQKFRDTSKFHRDSHDCDDFAREATYLAKRWSHRNYAELPASIAYGSAYIRIVGRYPLGAGMDCSPQSPGYHVINVFQRNDGKWFFLEPQKGRVEEALSLIYEGVVEVLRIEI